MTLKWCILDDAATDHESADSRPDSNWMGAGYRKTCCRATVGAGKGVAGTAEKYLATVEDLAAVDDLVAVGDPAVVVVPSLVEACAPPRSPGVA